MYDKHVTIKLIRQALSFRYFLYKFLPDENHMCTEANVGTNENDLYNCLACFVIRRWKINKGKLLISTLFPD